MVIRQVLWERWVCVVICSGNQRRRLLWSSVKSCGRGGGLLCLLRGVNICCTIMLHNIKIGVAYLVD